MKTIYLLALLGIMTVGCGQSPKYVDFQKGFHYEVREVDAGHQAKGRFYFIHGMGQKIADLKAGEWDRMADSMHAQDLEVVYIGWDFIDYTDMTNGGQDYITKFQGWIFSLNEKLQAQRQMPQTFIGGASMGGWHSVIASEVIQNDGVYASQVVTKIEVLWPFNGADTSACDLDKHQIPANFFVSAGTADTTIAWWNTKAIYGTHPNYHEYAGHSHGPYVDEYNDMINWMIAQII